MTTPCTPRQQQQHTATPPRSPPARPRRPPPLVVEERELNLVAHARISQNHVTPTNSTFQQQLPLHQIPCYTTPLTYDYQVYLNKPEPSPYVIFLRFLSFAFPLPSSLGVSSPIVTSPIALAVLQLSLSLPVVSNESEAVLSWLCISERLREEGEAPRRKKRSV